MNKKRLIIFISSVSVIALLFGYLKLTDKEKIIPVDAAAFMKSASEELSGYKLYLQKYKNARLPEGSMVDIVSDETTIPSGSQKGIYIFGPNDRHVSALMRTKGRR